MKKNHASRKAAPSHGESRKVGGADARKHTSFDDVGGPGMDSLMGAGKHDAEHKKDGSAK